MIQQITQKVPCPKCQTENEVLLWEKVNVTMQPDLKEKLFLGTLNFLKCENCNHETRVDIPIIYHDMDKKFFIHFAPEYPMDKEEELVENLNQETKALFDASYNNRLRVAFNYRSLIEKVKILDDDLDDRAVEICKILARTQLKLMEGEAFYDSKNEEFLQFFFVEAKDITSGNIGDVKEFSVPIKMYTTVQDLVEEKDPGEHNGFRIVGLPFAVELMNRTDA